MYILIKHKTIKNKALDVFMLSLRADSCSGFSSVLSCLHKILYSPL